MKNDQDYSLELDIEEIMKITDKKLLQKMIQQSVERNMQLKDTQIKNHAFGFSYNEIPQRLKSKLGSE